MNGEWSKQGEVRRADGHRRDGLDGGLERIRLLRAPLVIGGTKHGDVGHGLDGQHHGGDHRRATAVHDLGRGQHRGDGIARVT